LAASFVYDAAKATAAWKTCGNLINFSKFVNNNIGRDNKKIRVL
jgi:hypothetical protein